MAEILFLDFGRGGEQGYSDTRIEGRIINSYDSRAMSERNDIENYTSLFRTDTDPFWIRLREAVRERGVEPSTSLLVDSFEDDANFEFGIIVTRDRRVIQYGFCYIDSVADGKMAEWNDLTEHWDASPYRLVVSEGLSLLEEGA